MVSQSTLTTSNKDGTASTSPFMVFKSFYKPSHGLSKHSRNLSNKDGTASTSPLMASQFTLTTSNKDGIASTSPLMASQRTLPTFLTRME